MSSNESKRWSILPTYTPSEYLNWAEHFKALSPKSVQPGQSSNISYLYIPSGEKFKKFLKEKSSRLRYVQDIFTSILTILEFFTLFKYCVRFPVLDLFIPRGTPPQRQMKRLRALGLCFIAAMSLVYGYYQALRICEWNSSCVTMDLQYYVVAKLGSRLTTFFFVIGIILMFRAVTSYFNEIPWKVNIGWRRLHIECMIMAMASAVIHTVSHGLRTVHTLLPNWSYEYYFLATGCVLWCLFLSQYIQYFVLRLLERFKINNPWLEKGMKWWFRHVHVMLFKFCAFVYYCHSGEISPFALYMVWLFCEMQFQLEIVSCTVKFTPDRQNYEYCEIIPTYDNKIPDEFGYYCQICILDMGGASYTQIPLEDGHTAVFKIKNCILGDKLLDYVNASFPVSEGKKRMVPEPLKYYSSNLF